MRRAAAFFVLGVLGSSGCIYSPTSGGDAGAGDGGTLSVGDQCMAIDTEFCTQAINRCALMGFDLATCVSNNMSQCCTGSGCSKLSMYPQSAVDVCKGDIDVEDCNGIVNSTTPQSCQTLLHQ